MGLEARRASSPARRAGIILATAEAACSSEGARVLLVARDTDEVAAAMAEPSSAAEPARRRRHRRRGRRGRRRRVRRALRRRRRARQLRGHELRPDARGAHRRSTAGLAGSLNVMGPLRLMRSLMPRLAAGARGAHLLRLLDRSGKRRSLRSSRYSLTKAALLSLSRASSPTATSGDWRARQRTVAPAPVTSPLWLGEGGLADQAAWDVHHRPPVGRCEPKTGEVKPFGRLRRAG